MISISWSVVDARWGYEFERLGTDVSVLGGRVRLREESMAFEKTSIMTRCTFRVLVDDRKSKRSQRLLPNC